MSANIENCISNLVLVRLLPSQGKSLTLNKIKQDLQKIGQLLGSTEDGDKDLKEVLEELRSLDMIEEVGSGKYQITDKGVRAARSYLGAEYFPRKLDWRTVKEKYLLARSLGITISSAKELKKISNADNIRSEVIRRGLELDLPELPTPTQTKGSASWLALGVKTKTALTLGTVRTHLINQLVDTSRPLDEDQVFKLLAAKHAGARNSSARSLREAILKNLVKSSDQPDQAVDSAPRQNELRMLAREILKVAEKTRTGRHGEDKVFISHVWKHWQSEGSTGFRTIQEFKESLIEAHRAGELTLSEADLPDQLDHSDVRESVTPYLNARFHFIRLTGGR